MMMSVWITQHPPPDEITIRYYNPTGLSSPQGAHMVCVHTSTGDVISSHDLISCKNI